MVASFGQALCNDLLRDEGQLWLGNEWRRCHRCGYSRGLHFRKKLIVGIQDETRWRGY